MTADTILAVDLGRYKSVACAYHRGTRDHAFRTLDTPPDLTRLLGRHPGGVVSEACANAGWVHDLAVAVGHPVKVANTAAEAWKFRHLMRKTNRDDARRLGEPAAIGPLPAARYAGQQCVSSQRAPAAYESRSAGAWANSPRGGHPSPRLAGKRPRRKRLQPQPHRVLCPAATHARSA